MLAVEMAVEMAVEIDSSRLWKLKVELRRYSPESMRGGKSPSTAIAAGGGDFIMLMEELSLVGIKQQHE